MRFALVIGLGTSSAMAPSVACRDPRACAAALDLASDRILLGRAGEACDDALVGLVLGPDARISLQALGGLGGLLDMTPRELSLVPGLGRDGAVRLLATLEIGRRASSRAPGGGAPIRSSGDVHALVARRISRHPREVVLALSMAARGRVVGEHRISEGGLDGCPVSPRDVFGLLLRDRAASCILVHNHPSGDPQPSPEDRTITARMSDAGRMLGIRLLDHVIVAAGGWFSFRDSGLL